MKIKMKVKIKKVHPIWNFLYENEFNVGDIIDLIDGVVISKNGKKFNADDLVSRFSSWCSYDDIFEKVIKEEQP